VFVTIVQTVFCLFVVTLQAAEKLKSLSEVHYKECGRNRSTVQ